MFHVWAAVACLLLVRTGFAQSICQIQGVGNSSPYAGQQVTTEGIVTALFTGPGSLNGYFLERPDCDADASSSNGIFVYDPSPGAVAVGQRLSVTAMVVEFNGVTELTDPSVQVLGSGDVIPTSMELPIASSAHWERHEGMLLVFPSTLTVTDNEGWVQYGEVYLAPQRLITPTESIDPNDPIASGTNSTGMGNVAAIEAEWDLIDRSYILLDDGRTSTFPSPSPWMDASGTLRTGSTITGLVGVLHFAFGEYRLEPVGGVPIVHAERPPVPDVGGTVRAASLNVLNYFTTLGEWGAQNNGELTRQRTKLVEAIRSMDADVLALCELENTDAAWIDLLGALNTAVGPETYACLEEDGIGGGTRTVILYRPGVLSPVTALFSLNTGIFQRPHLTQGFQVNATGARFLFSTIHLRSKSCDNAMGANLDQGDGQGCFNDNRRAQANALIQHWAGSRTITGIEAQLVMGDFNAYSEEDPVDVLRSAGMQRLVSAPSHSYSYFGTFGSLDHAFGTASMADAITGAEVWHINSDEPRALDYTDANVARYQSNAYRCSDHDPVIVGLDGAQLPVGVAPVPDRSDATFTLSGTTGLWSLTEPASDPVELAIHDARGALVHASISRGGLHIESDLSGLAAGMHVWHLRVGGAFPRVATGRFVIP